MTKDDTKALLQKIQANFAWSFKDASKENMMIMWNTWYELLGKYDTDIMVKALDMHLVTKTMPPTIADMIQNASIVLKQKRIEQDINKPMLTSSDTVCGMPEECREKATKIFGGE
jgi:hypothetical protein